MKKMVISKTIPNEGRRFTSSFPTPKVPNDAENQQFPFPVQKHNSKKSDYVQFLARCNRTGGFIKSYLVEAVFVFSLDRDYFLCFYDICSSLLTLDSSNYIIPTASKITDNGLEESCNLYLLTIFGRCRCTSMLLVLNLIQWVFTIGH